MEKHTHEEHIVGKSGDYTVKGTINDSPGWANGTYTGGVSIKGSFELVDDTPGGMYDVRIKTDCDGYDHTYENVSQGQSTDFKKITTSFFDETVVKIYVNGKENQTGDFKLVVNYQTC